MTTTVTAADGQPAADEPIVITRDGDTAPAVTTTTDADGGLTAALLPEQTYTAVLDGAADQPITFTTGTTSGAIAPLAQPAPPVTTPPGGGGGTGGGGTGGVAGSGAGPGAGDPGTTTTATRQELAFTGSATTLPATAGAGLLLLTGVVLVLVGRRRRTVR